MTPTIPSLSEQAERARISREIASHPLLRDHMTALSARLAAEKDQRISALKSEIASLDAECKLFSAAQAELDVQQQALHQAYRDAIGAIEQARLEIQQKVSPNRDRRRNAVHEMQIVEGTRPAGPSMVWLPTKPDWFTDSGRDDQIKQLPAPHSFAPKAIETTTWHGNTPVTTVTYDRPPLL